MALKKSVSDLQTQTTQNTNDIIIINTALNGESGSSGYLQKVDALETETESLDARVTALEDGGGSGGDSWVYAEMPVGNAGNQINLTCAMKSDGSIFMIMDDVSEYGLGHFDQSTGALENFGFSMLPQFEPYFNTVYKTATVGFCYYMDITNSRIISIPLQFQYDQTASLWRLGARGTVMPNFISDGNVMNSQLTFGATNIKY